MADGLEIKVMHSPTKKELQLTDRAKSFFRDLFASEKRSLNSGYVLPYHISGAQQTSGNYKKPAYK